MHGGLECENVGVNSSRDTKFDKKSMLLAFVVGMLVGTLGLAAVSSLGPAVLSARQFAAPVGAATRTSAKQGLRSEALKMMSDAVGPTVGTAPEALKLDDPEAVLNKAGSDFCSRRNALGRAASAAAAMIGAPALVSAAANVNMGDAGKLVFNPAELTVCKGDTVTWTIESGAPHNIIFKEDDCPEGFDADAASNENLMKKVGETHSYTFDIAGSYSYVCAPHAGAGMKGAITVK
jgi:plastocyanin